MVNQLPRFMVRVGCWIGEPPTSLYRWLVRHERLQIRRLMQLDRPEREDRSRIDYSAEGNYYCMVISFAAAAPLHWKERMWASSYRGIE